MYYIEKSIHQVTPILVPYLGYYELCYNECGNAGASWNSPVNLYLGALTVDHQGCVLQAELTQAQEPIMWGIMSSVTRSMTAPVSLCEHFAHHGNV